MKREAIVLVLIPLSSPRQSDQGGDRKIQSKSATKQYCQGWDNIFGTKQPIAQA